jgi:hypothetical protein
MRSIVRVEAQQRCSCTARARCEAWFVSRRDSGALAPRERDAKQGRGADRGKHTRLPSRPGALAEIFDRVNREYLDSMMAVGGEATSVVGPLSSVVCSGEECLHARPSCSRLARMIDGEGICPPSSVFCRLPSGACPCERRV